MGPIAALLSLGKPFQGFLQAQRLPLGPMALSPFVTLFFRIGMRPLRFGSTPIDEEKVDRNLPDQ